MATDERWKHDGVRVIPGTKLDPNTPQTPGMDRKAAITFARVGTQKLWAGTVHIHPNANRLQQAKKVGFRLGNIANPPQLLLQPLLDRPPGLSRMTFVRIPIVLEIVSWGQMVVPSASNVRKARSFARLVTLVPP